MSGNKVVIFSAPSGAGKTTIVKEMLLRFPRLSFSVSACSRNARKGETHGKDYYFLSVDEFRNRIAKNDFLEWEEVYENNFYGTLKSEVERIWSEGKEVIFDVDVKGGINIKKYFGDQALAVFVMPPSVEELGNRLRGRSTDDEATILKRLEKAEYEISFAGQFDLRIVNDQLDVAMEEAFRALKTFLEN